VTVIITHSLSYVSDLIVLDSVLDPHNPECGSGSGVLSECGSRFWIPDPDPISSMPQNEKKFKILEIFYIFLHFYLFLDF